MNTKQMLHVAGAVMIGNMLAEQLEQKSRRERIVDAWVIQAAAELAWRLRFDDDATELSRVELLELERELAHGALAAVGTVLSARPPKAAPPAEAQP